MSDNFSSRYKGMEDVLLPVPGVENSSKEQYKKNPAKAWIACVLWLLVTVALIVITLVFWGGPIFADVVLFCLFFCLSAVALIASFLPVKGWLQASQERKREQHEEKSHH